MNTYPEQLETGIMPVTVIASIIQRNLENPPLSKASRDKAIKVKSKNQHGLVLETQKPNSTSAGKPVRKLSFQDREDIAQEILATLTEYGLMPQGKRSRVGMLRAENSSGDQFFTGGGHCLAWLHKQVKSHDVHGNEITVSIWQELFRRCRLALRMQYMIEGRGKVYIEDQLPETIEAIQTERHYRQDDVHYVEQPCIDKHGKKFTRYTAVKHTTPRRKALANDAKMMKRLIFEAFKADKSRKRKAKFKSAHLFLKRSIGTVQERGHGLNQMSRGLRFNTKCAFRDYVRRGAQALSEQESNLELKSFDQLPAFIS